MCRGNFLAFSSVEVTGATKLITQFAFVYEIMFSLTQITFLIFHFVCPLVFGRFMIISSANRIQGSKKLPFKGTKEFDYQLSYVEVPDCFYGSYDADAGSCDESNQSGQSDESVLKGKAHNVPPTNAP